VPHKRHIRDFVEYSTVSSSNCSSICSCCSLTLCVFQQVDIDWFCAYLMDVLKHETQPSVRFLAEWTLIRLVLHYSKLYSFLLDLLSEVITHLTLLWPIMSVDFSYSLTILIVITNIVVKKLEKSFKETSINVFFGKKIKKKKTFVKHHKNVTFYFACFTFLVAVVVVVVFVVVVVIIREKVVIIHVFTFCHCHTCC